MQTLVNKAEPAAIELAAGILRKGGLVAFPTETVYGLGADATCAEAVARIYAAKQRPSFNPLIAHVADSRAARFQGLFDNHAEKLAEAFWPGPLTLVTPASADCTVSLLARAGLDTLALRVPAHPVARALLLAFDRPVAAPSANVSGTVSPTTAEHVRDGLDGRIDMILDGGACQVGLESTIVDCTGGRPRILRPGGVPRASIEAVLGLALSPEPLSVPATYDVGIVAPGMLASHYAPRAKVVLDGADFHAGDAVLDFGGALANTAAVAAAYEDLSPRADPVEAAANLFAAMRRLDASGAGRIVVAPVSGHDIGEAINDRLKRAAAEG
ncbi:MAG: L-threonylcarbamoyladenylate synthase [Beijerinckiaceae bacterium]